MNYFGTPKVIAFTVVMVLVTLCFAVIACLPPRRISELVEISGTLDSFQRELDESSPDFWSVGYAFAFSQDR